MVKTLISIVSACAIALSLTLSPGMAAADHSSNKWDNRAENLTGNIYRGVLKRPGSKQAGKYAYRKAQKLTRSVKRRSRNAGKKIYKWRKSRNRRSSSW